VDKKIPPRGRMLGFTYLKTRIGCDTGQRLNYPSLALRPKLPATADQREVRESRPVCRYRLLTRYSALRNRI
jgi:hypothetical protein